MEILLKAAAGVSQKPAGDNFAQDLIRQAVKTDVPTPPEPETPQRPPHMENLVKRQRELSGDPGVSLPPEFEEEAPPDSPEDVPESAVPPTPPTGNTPSAVSALMPQRKPASSNLDILSAGFVEEKEPVSIPLFSSDGLDWTGPEWMTLRLATYNAARGITLESKEYLIEIKGKRLVKVILSIQSKKLSRISPSPPAHEKDSRIPFISSVEITEKQEDEE